jgi:putative transposase
MLTKPARHARPAMDRRRILDAILYVVKRGFPRGRLSADFLAWQKVYHLFRQWTRSHRRAVLNAALFRLFRQTHGKGSPPTAAILGGQSVKFARRGGVLGYEAAKRSKARKGHLLRDILGWSRASL